MLHFCTHFKKIQPNYILCLSVSILIANVDDGYIKLSQKQEYLMKSNNLILSSSALAMAIAALAPTVTKAAALDNPVNNAAQLGSAFAGAGADTKDVGVISKNPAIASFLTGRFNAAVQGTYFLPKATFYRNESAYTDEDLYPDFFPPIARFKKDAETREKSFIPSLHMTYKATDTFTVGLALTSPFGLTTKYPENWFGRHLAVETDLKTYNINPFVSIKFNDVLSMGIGAVFQYADIKMSKQFDNRGFVTLGREREIDDILIRTDGTDWGYGFNVGLLIKPSQNIDVGIHYRSRIRHKINNELILLNNIAGDAITGIKTLNLIQKIPINTGFVLPESASINYSQTFSDVIRVKATAEWTRWSTLKELKMTTPSPHATAQNNIINKPEPLDWKDTWFLAAGFDWMVDNQLTLKAGYAYDYSPVPFSTRTPRVPENDRQWLTVGADWQVDDQWKISLSYAHIFVKRARIDQRAIDAMPLKPGNLDNTKGKDVIGSFESHVDVIGLQLSYKM